MIDEFVEIYSGEGYEVFEEDDILWFRLPMEKANDRTISRLKKRLLDTGYKKSFGIQFVRKSDAKTA